MLSFQSLPLRASRLRIFGVFSVPANIPAIIFDSDEISIQPQMAGWLVNPVNSVPELSDGLPEGHEISHG